MRRNTQHKQGGITLVEVLITMVILAIGLLGLAGLQARLKVLQFESYQRAQALMLLKDMSGRIANNRNNAADYADYDTDNPLGIDVVNCAAIGTATRVAADAAEWCTLLQGASELSEAGNEVGAMVGARGCVDDLGGDQYLVTVAWQGLAPISAPPVSVTCGAGDYDGGADSPCEDDLCRRVVTTIVRIATLT
jgi:type IV pilus assembly protein PilV